MNLRKSILSILPLAVVVFFSPITTLAESPEHMSDMLPDRPETVSNALDSVRDNLVGFGENLSMEVVSEWIDNRGKQLGAIGTRQATKLSYGAHAYAAGIGPFSDFMNAYNEARKNPEFTKKDAVIYATSRASLTTIAGFVGVMGGKKGSAFMSQLAANLHDYIYSTPTMHHGTWMTDPSLENYDEMVQQEVASLLDSDTLEASSYGGFTDPYADNPEEAGFSCGVDTDQDGYDDG